MGTNPGWTTGTTEGDWRCSGGNIDVVEVWAVQPPVQQRDDMHCDGMMDFGDFMIYADCMSGPDVHTVPPGCDPLLFARADLDHDGDVDLSHIAVFQQVFGGW